jgi:hypothetical protein
MTGNDNTIALQHTRQHDSALDKVGQYVLKKRGRSSAKAPSPMSSPTMSAS